MTNIPASPLGSLPANNAAAVSKSDTTVFDQMTRAVWVGGVGDIAVRMASGAVVTFVGVPAGSLLPIACDKVMSTNTSATNMVRIW